MSTARVLLARAVPALLVPTLVAFAVPGPAQAATVIDTIDDWDGGFNVQPFGTPNTATYAQTVTVPAGETGLSSYTLVMDVPSALVVRGEVYAWDGTTERATGSSLYESGPRSTQGDGFEHVTFDTGGVPVTAGSTYVLMVTASIDDGQPDLAGAVALVDDAVGYPGGSFVDQNNGADESKWTSTTWAVSTGYDLAFRAEFGPPATVAVAAPSITGLAQVGQTLTAHPGAVTPVDSALSYQWLADGNPVVGATGTTLLLTPDLAGARIKVRVRASHSGYLPASATSAPTQYVRELVKHPQAVIDTTALCSVGSVDVLGQGLTPGNSYTITGVGPTVTRTADVYGEVHATLQVPPSWTNGPHEDHSVAISGTHPKVNVAAVFVLNCR